MVVFHIDLDNTVIYSHRHDIGPDRVNVEVLREREISFATAETLEMLREVTRRMLLVPTTTRTEEQYRRIHLGIGRVKYALVCNGGVLLVDGAEDGRWYQESLKLVAAAGREMRYAQQYLERDRRRIFELRFIRDLFLFTKCNGPEEVVGDLRDHLQTDLVSISCHGSKVYVIPKGLEKGRAVGRFREYIGGGEVIAAGDSEMDISMLNAADLGIAPDWAREDGRLCAHVVCIPGNEIFSEGLLRCVLSYLELSKR